MFVEHRTYTMRPGAVPEYLARYEESGTLDLQERGGPCMGWYTVEAGDLHHVVNLWRFDSFEQRLEVRAQLAQEPAWQGFMGQVQPLVQGIRSQLLLPSRHWAEKSAIGRIAMGGSDGSSI